MAALTEADRCRQAQDPYRAAVSRCAYKSSPSPERKVFHFADRSSLGFTVTYQLEVDSHEQPAV